MFLSCMRYGSVFLGEFDNFVCVSGCRQFLRGLAAIDKSVLLGEIEELKKKRSQALTEEQKIDIFVAYPRGPFPF